MKKLGSSHQKFWEICYIFICAIGIFASIWLLIIFNIYLFVRFA